MMDITIDTSGLDDYLDSIDARVKEATKKSADAVAERSKQNIRSLDAIDTGNMLNTTRARPIEPSDGYEGFAVHSDAPYEIHVELGTARTVAKPHLLPAAEVERQAMIERIIKALQP